MDRNIFLHRIQFNFSKCCLVLYIFFGLPVLFLCQVRASTTPGNLPIPSFKSQLDSLPSIYFSKVKTSVAILWEHPIEELHLEQEISEYLSSANIWTSDNLFYQDFITQNFQKIKSLDSTLLHKLKKDNRCGCIMLLETQIATTNKSTTNILSKTLHAELNLVELSGFNKSKMCFSIQAKAESLKQVDAELKIKFLQAIYDQGGFFLNLCH